jgi:hypothetical protein
MSAEKGRPMVCTANFKYCDPVGDNMALCEECGIPYCSIPCRDWDTEVHLKKCSAMMLKKQSQAALATKRRNSF